MGSGVLIVIMPPSALDELSTSIPGQYRTMRIR